MLEYAASLDPASREMMLDLAIAKFHSGGAKQALELIARVAEAQRSGDYFLAQAQMLAADGRPLDAAAAIKAGLQANPSREDLYAAAVQFLVEQNRTDAALGVAEDACRKLPGQPMPLLLRAEVLARLQEPREAELLLKEVESRWPEWSPAYTTYAGLLESQSRTEEAKGQRERADVLAGRAH